MPKNTLDIMHRRYIAYLEADRDSAEGKRLRSYLIRADGEGESFSSSLCTCEVKTDWIEYIEKTLPFIERALHENRQFIMRQGETLPIEKIRRVSKLSVEHLARHSELITREPPEGEDIIPEKLFMTENISTYAVYENRFLYMLLCYIKDFTEIKHSKIAETVNSFATDLVYEKNVAEKGRMLSFSLRFKETSTGGAGELDTGTEEAIYRMKAIIAAVDTLLKTNLMIEVSSAPMLKPPISRTNVLLQNPCFAAAVELYDYLTAYTGAGFTVKALGGKEDSLDANARADCAELVALTSYLTYRNSGLRETLDDRYAAEEAERAREEKRLRDERLEELKQRMGDVDAATLEYIFALEEKCRQNDDEITRLTEGNELMILANQKLDEAEKIRTSAERELANIRGELIKLEEQIKHDNAKYERALSDADREKAALESRLGELNENFKAEYSALAEEYRVISARLRAIHGDSEEDLTSKEAFTELEAEYLAFKSFFEKQWKLAKKRIRRESLNKK